jgi:hypothetical protein
MPKMEPPADISGISMEIRHQRLGRVEVHPYPEPPPDMSGYKMETINDGGGWVMVVGIPLIGLMVAGFIYLCWLVL